MKPNVLSEVLSSRIKLSMLNALSLRPRTLGELADVTGISVQGVIRHLKRLESLGLVGEMRMKARTPRARIVYVWRGSRIGDYSNKDIIVVKATENLQSETTHLAWKATSEEMAGDLILGRRRVREQAKRLGREIDALVGYQEALDSMLDGQHLPQEDRLILGVLLTEETIDDGRKVLSEYYGLEDRRSIDEVLAKARRVVN